MLSRALQASGQNAARLTRQHAGTARRTFAISAIRNADLVQDMYLRELKNYKVPPVKANDAEGQVQKFTAPKAPKSPEESNLADDLKSYESQKVEVEGQSSEGGVGAATHEWFEEPDYDDDSKDAHH